MASRKILSIVIGTYNRVDFLRATIASIRQEISGIDGCEIIVIDGGSIDGTKDWLSEQKDVLTIIHHNRGEWNNVPIPRRSWGYFMNLGFKCAEGKFICMLSDDCLVVPNAIKNGIKLFEEKLDAEVKLGALAFYWRDWPEQDKYRVGLTLGRNMFVNHGIYLSAALHQVNFIDENTYDFYHADGDLCLKLLKNGWITIDCKDSFIEHYSHANLQVRASNMTNQPRDWRAYYERWSYLNPESEPNFEGDWIELSFHDTSGAAKEFQKLIDATNTNSIATNTNLQQHTTLNQEVNPSTETKSIAPSFILSLKKGLDKLFR